MNARFVALLVLLATSVLASGSACSMNVQRSSAESLDDLLETWREVSDASVRDVDASGDQRQGLGTWIIRGQGDALGTDGEVTLAADDAGRFRFELDGPVPFAEVFDGQRAWRLSPWGAALELRDWEYEKTLIMNWAMTGFWLDPRAPLDRRLGEAPSSTTVSVELGFIDSKHRFIATVDERSGRVRRIGPKSHGISFEHVMDPAPPQSPFAYERLQLVSAGRTMVDVRFDSKRERADESTVWLPPVEISQATFDPSVPSGLDVRSTTNGFLYAKLQINGTPMGWFLVDTGAPATIIDLSAKQRLELVDVGRGKRTGVGGTTTAMIHRVESQKLGPLELGPSWMIGADVSGLSQTLGIQLDGILGCDLLSKAVVEYDIAGRSITIHDPASFEDEGLKWFPLKQSEGKPVITARVEGHTLDLNLDSAASGALTLGYDIVDELDLMRDRSTRTSYSQGLSGMVQTQSGQVSSLELGDRVIENVPTSFSVKATGALAYPFPDGLIGTQVMDDTIIFFDMSRRRIAFVER